MEEYPHELLSEARVRAMRLVKGLEEQAADLEANPPDLPPAKLALGRQAMTNALASARRALAALEDAMKIAQRERN